MKTKRKAGDEPFYKGNRTLDFNVLEFWQWSSSDLLNNTTRGILAEFLVTRALGGDGVRKEWVPFDVKTPDGIRVEVKSAAYLQSWPQAKPSAISFSVKPTYAWDAETNLFAEQRKRQADVYVFCLLDHKDRATVDPLDLTQWRFFGLNGASKQENRRAEESWLEEVAAGQGAGNNL